MVRRRIVRVFLLLGLCGHDIGARYDNCTSGIVDEIRDGLCDRENNNEGCRYDGGDCCPCTTIRTSRDDDDDNYPLFCLDPNSGCADPLVDIYPNCTDGYIPDIGDGVCDVENNKKQCGYDGGDCCECTSTDDDSFFSIYCVDPSAACYDPVAVALQSNCTDGYIPGIGDGWCEMTNNNEGCLYDGGDCCECTHTDDGSSFFSSLCVDPSAACYNPSVVALQSTCTDGYIANVGNGRCEFENNNEGCRYDGGDCCPCTAIRTSRDDDGAIYFPLFCLDPNSGCVDPLVDIYPNCTGGYVPHIGDGVCDVENNNKQCGYDGGDCCECTSTDDDYFFSFYCVNPSAACYDPVAVALQSNCTDGYIPGIGDGWCEVRNNNEECLYDGGDCCECVGTYDASSASPSLCMDPSAACYDPAVVALQLNCTDGYFTDIGNGRCDVENNNEACVYDGGDCCPCTCTHGTYHDCGVNGFSCVDPGVADDLKHYICEELPPIHTPCTFGFQREWVVENTTQARELAEAVRCLSGSFNVLWKGQVIVEETISVADGTILYVQGDDANAAIIGGGETALFTVVNASLNLSNITIRSGYAMYGGAIAASHSRLTIDRVKFDSNNATRGGGALSLSEGTTVSFGIEVAFTNNTARAGGAIYVTGGSNASWAGNTTFSENSASTGQGGALYVTSGSSVVWTAASHFVNNTAEYGGALYVEGRSVAIWNTTSHFLANTAARHGGTLHFADGSTAAWNAVSFFSQNSATSSGGALSLSGGSTAMWSAKSFFLENSATSFGGALYLTGGSTAIWTAKSFFSANSARYGGALSLWGRSTTVWRAASFFRTNSAGSGGAMYLAENCSASWSSASFFSNNSADSFGGALSLMSLSSAVWRAVSFFSANYASEGAGGLYLEGSTAEWSAGTYFSANTAGSGGALGLSGSSTAVWSAESFFSANSAIYGGSGGALSLSIFSSVAWSAESFFFVNTADSDGGALALSSSTATWSAESFFANNVGTSGGAVFLYDASAAWTASSIFSANGAKLDGGAVHAISGNISWNADAIFVNNTARNGGAISAEDGSTAEWTAATNFTSNSAKLNGGAVNSRALDLKGYYKNSKFSVIAIKGPTSFVGNTCGANGGGIALVEMMGASLESEKIVFAYNTAGVSGGAVYVLDIAIGTAFRDVMFQGNVARIGGGVRATGSGTAVTVDGENKRVVNPLTFDRCKFVGNFAFGTGGAVDSASGLDVFNLTLFKGNKARVGGALRLAGKASVINCSFIDNFSDLGGGPAVSNVGYVSNMAASYFRNNAFNCESQAFLDFKSDDIFRTVCDGCPDFCFKCSFEGKHGSPTCTSLSEAAIEHATSDGGNTTVEGLHIHVGYWRATNTSTNVYKCFNTRACSGGITGALDYCLPGYKGPYCAVCSKNYVSSLSFKCRECSDRAVGVVIVAVAIVLVATVGLALFSYLVSTKEVGAGRGMVDCVTQRLPMQSVKIILVLWQILTQFASVANVTFPNVYQKLLEGVDILNFDLSWIVSAGCFLEMNFHDRLFLTTMAPIVTMCLLRGTYIFAVRRNRGSSEDALGNVRQKHRSMALLVTFLVYSSVSSVVFQMFTCEYLDDGKRYLRADYTIDCDSPKHRAFQVYAGLMILLYPLGIPAFYVFLLFSNRHLLRNEEGREESLVATSTSDLWKPYKPQRFYYEVIECGRRILLAGVMVFIYPNTGAQIAVALAIAVVFVFVSEGMAPYHSQWDAWISRLGHAIIFVTIYLALLLKVDVSGENDSSQKTFEVILVVAHGCMILAVVVEAVIMALRLRVGTQLEDPRPRRRRPPINP